MISSDPNKPIPIRVGVPTNKVMSKIIKTKASREYIIEIIGKKINSGTNVTTQHEIIFEKNILDKGTLEVKYKSKIPLSRSS
ncbi:MAG: hypothetical protein VX544_04725 [Pseudomonadota bacterium]|nr:hypothetical protein [Pseudomonadota bacterium]